ncbi:hypothetical protein COM62_11835 [Bacillus pseudomycoides]|nr:hypothetical protein COM62_11835 [Bacillus pseudomycoides]
MHLKLLLNEYIFYKVKNITISLQKLLIIFVYDNIILFVEIKTKIIHYLGDMENGIHSKIMVL